jgi:hypothetical protein
MDGLVPRIASDRGALLLKFQIAQPRLLYRCLRYGQWLPRPWALYWTVVSGRMYDQSRMRTTDALYHCTDYRYDSHLCNDGEAVHCGYFRC